MSNDLRKQYPATYAFRFSLLAETTDMSREEIQIAIDKQDAKNEHIVSNADPVAGLTRNADRAEWAAQTLLKFMAITQSDAECAIADLLCDLRHLCDRLDLDHAIELAKAKNHYTHEVSEAQEDVTAS